MKKIFLMVTFILFLSTNVLANDLSEDEKNHLKNFSFVYEDENGDFYIKPQKPSIVPFATIGYTYFSKYPQVIDSNFSSKSQYFKFNADGNSSYYATFFATTKDDKVISATSSLKAGQREKLKINQSPVKIWVFGYGSGTIHYCGHSSPSRFCTSDCRAN